MGHSMRSLSRSGPVFRKNLKSVTMAFKQLRTCKLLSPGLSCLENVLKIHNFAESSNLKVKKLDLRFFLNSGPGPTKSWRLQI